MVNAQLHKKIDDLQEMVSEIDSKLTVLIEQNQNMGKVAECRMFNYTQAAAYLGLDVEGLRGLVHKRQIACYKPNGKNVFFDPIDLDTWLERNRLDAEWESDQPYKRTRICFVIDEESEKELNLERIREQIEIIRPEPPRSTEEIADSIDEFALQMVDECRKTKE